MISRTMTFRFAYANQFVERYKKTATESILSLLSEPPYLQFTPSDHPFGFAENL